KKTQLFFEGGNQAVDLAKDQQALLPDERRPLNQYAKSMFGRDLFDISFFSPNERYRVTEKRIKLGAKLFYDTILSAGNKRSCASCHKPELAFTDGAPKALSVDGQSTVDRNTPTLWNAALQTKYFYDSRASTLENQLSIVVHSSKEMNGSMETSILKLRKEEKYAALFQQAYAGDQEPVTAYSIANAVSSYIRSLTALNSQFDQYIRDQEKPLSRNERSGFNLYAGKAKCATCHYLPLFNGLIPPEFSETESEVLGTPASTDTLHAMIDPDMGKFLFTNAVPHQHSFKTPTLRNIALTAPYMHNGVYKTLEEVLDFYNKGGGSGLQIAIPNQTLPAEKLGLTKKETQDIIAFLKTLTDTTYNTQLYAK
ncbi:MAG: cytochrome c peroxidase, partial [Flavitalea sp.]